MSEPEEILKSLIGTWQGTCRTWFKPDELADESTITGKIEPILGELFVRHTYESTIQGKPRSGDETIAFNSVTTTSAPTRPPGAGGRCSKWSTRIS